MKIISIYFNHKKTYDILKNKNLLLLYFLFYIKIFIDIGYKNTEIFINY